MSELSARERRKQEREQAAQAAEDAPANLPLPTPATTDVPAAPCAPHSADVPLSTKAAVLIGVMGLCYSKQLTWLPLVHPERGESLFELVTETVQHTEQGGPLPPASPDDNEGEACAGEGAATDLKNAARPPEPAENGKLTANRAEPSTSDKDGDKDDERRGCILA